MSIFYFILLKTKWSWQNVFAIDKLGHWEDNFLGMSTIYNVNHALHVYDVSINWHLFKKNNENCHVKVNQKNYFQIIFGNMTKRI